jgi:hypothetical protein
VRIGGEPKVLGESPVQFHFVHHKFHVTWPGWWEIGYERPELQYGQ